MKHLSVALVLVLLAATLHAQPRVTFGPEAVVHGPFYTPAVVALAEQRPPSFAAAGRDGHYLLAWTEYPDTTLTCSQLVTAKIDANGTIVPGSRRVAAAYKTIDPDAGFPAVAFDGERFLVAWIEGRGLIARVVAMRFDRDGVPLDPIPQPIALEARRTYVAVAGANGTFWITYGAAVSSRPAVARLAADGTALERERTLNTIAGFWRDIETNGTSAVLVSESSTQSNCLILFCPPNTLRGFAATPSAAGEWRPTWGESSGTSVGVGTGLATDGTRYLSVSKIENLAIGQFGWIMRGRLIDATGANVIREFVIAKHQDNISEPPGGRIDATWTGGMYALAYELRDRTDLNLRLSFASPTGMALIDPVELAASAQQERNPVVLSIGDGRVLVLYERGTILRTEVVARTAALSIRTRAVR